jgi:hypothetical protein
LFDVRDSSAGGSDIGLSLIKLSAVVVVYDLDEDVAAVDPLEISHKNSADVARNLGGEWCRVSLKVGVIGALQGGGAYPPVPLAKNDENESTDKNENKQPDTGACPSE